MYVHPLTAALRNGDAWFHRHDSARSAINPLTGERIRVRTESERYNGLVENAWTNQW